MDAKMAPLPTLSAFFFFSCSLFFFFFISSHAQLLPVINNTDLVNDDDGSGDQQLQTYIVHVDRHRHHDILTNEELQRYHMSFLPNTTLASGEPRLLASYRHVMSGFAAQLTRAELQSLESMPGFIHAFPDEPEPLDTTHTPEFLGLSQPDTGFWAKYSNQGEGIIIAVLDSGLAVSHPSFSGEGMPRSPPDHWKANCTFDGICNNKVIGAVTFIKGKPLTDLPPDDLTNHGSAVASIAAGNFVANANVTRKANGTASGMAPKAHIAVYKACEDAKCNRTNKLAAGERAIEDGVDVIVIPSGIENLKYYQSSTDMIALAAVQKNIVVCASAGNGGRMKTIKNGAPWVITVGASTTDRIIGAPNRTRLAPKVAKFSSRGPSLVNGDILKPDVLAPGRQILTARANTSESPTLFKFSFGTSFAAPHVGGIVALIRKERPAWTAAMIQSAIITTADELDASGNPMLDQKTNKTADVFATGAGQVNAMRALDPGLVYDVKPTDHLGYLCYLGYTEDDFKGRPIIERILKCKDHQPIRPSDLNYASVSANLNVNWPAETFRRTVTNIGAAADGTVYEAHVVEPEGVKVFVRPKVLQFTRIDERKTFEVVLLLNGSSEGRTTARGKLEWRSSDGKYVVKSPIAVSFYLRDA